MLNITQMKLLNKTCVSLQVKANHTYLIRCPNGCGKSLLLRSIALLHQSSFKEFHFEGKSVETLNPQSFRRQVLYVPPVPLDTSSTVSYYFQSPWKLKAYQEQTPLPQCKEILIEKGFWSRDFSLLSSGEKQFVQILRALAINPQCLLLDETTSHMDFTKIKEVEKLIQEHQKEFKTTLIIVSHDENQISRLNATIWDFKNDLLVTP